MIPVMQQTKHDPENGQVGDCFKACIASLLEITDYDSIPHFATYPKAQWWDRFLDWMKSRGFKVFVGEGGQSDPQRYATYYIATGTSPRSLLHSVIYSNGNLAHDPNPEGGGVKDILYYIWIEKLPV
jgi:hypothetical protein